ncbi:hypothetical protein P691DRAFT_456851 [Macrolepiota fuliginosa MF-IS2]|uniref:Uncharacterized protein n=1 Tax=Macrolepiota fuliginosa MF-IS2 TaxID=1400762 RepID=A0A9P5XGZ2_9AGAR|nr:hypothetical protein P691DRAFT_456851 [Macrolepiota fuliginosa MF-IS2]
MWRRNGSRRRGWQWDILERTRGLAKAIRKAHANTCIVLDRALDYIKAAACPVREDPHEREKIVYQSLDRVSAVVVRIGKDRPSFWVTIVRPQLLTMSTRRSGVLCRAREGTIAMRTIPLALLAYYKTPKAYGPRPRASKEPPVCFSFEIKPSRRGTNSRYAATLIRCTYISTSAYVGVNHRTSH